MTYGDFLLNGESKNRNQRLQVSKIICIDDVIASFPTHPLTIPGGGRRGGCECGVTGTCDKTAVYHWLRKLLDSGVVKRVVGGGGKTSC